MYERFSPSEVGPDRFRWIGLIELDNVIVAQLPGCKHVNQTQRCTLALMCISYI